MSAHGLKNQFPSPAPSQKEVDNFVTAAREGDTVTVIYFIWKYAAAINQKNSDGYTAMIGAAVEGKKKIVGLLLTNGAQIDGRDIWSRTALMHAAQRGRTPTVALLLAKGADIGAINDKGETALMLARYNGQREIVELIEQWPELQRQRKEEERRRAEELFETRARELNAGRLEKLKNRRSKKPPFNK